ncbi:MAG: hypothetical protein IBX67_04820 [Dehalococcoidia bacterium]|nr:hypothetical protein [Dehalococcoidia bacterium]
MLSRKRWAKGGILAIIGWILSPLTWWNDLVVNIPIAYGLGYLFSLISESLFLPFMVIGYWITNIAGLVLLHKGVVTVVRKEERKYGRKDLMQDIAISLGYTALMVILVQLNVLRLPSEYLPGQP